jgi:predicted transposase/invertase (TIGR01784 family)
MFRHNADLVILHFFIQDKWLYLFRNMHKLKKIPFGFASRQFKLLFEIAKISNFTESELLDYEESMKYMDDNRAIIDYAKKEGRREGEARGIAIGRARGKAEGFMKAAKSMLAYGLDPVAVARITKLPKKQIMAMR